jgi:hypothetical protein
MTNNQRVLVAGFLSQLAQDKKKYSATEQNALFATSHELVGEKNSAVKYCPSEKEMEAAGFPVMENFKLDTGGIATANISSASPNSGTGKHLAGREKDNIEHGGGHQLPQQ